MALTIKARFLTLLITAATALAGMAQNAIDIKDGPRLDPNGLTAINDKVYDANDDVCAAVIIYNPHDEGFRFDGATKTSYVKDPATGDYYYKVYISPGTRRITIRHKDSTLGAAQLQFPYPVKSTETWEAWLQPIYRNKAVGGKQYLTIAVEPPTASVEVRPAGQSTGDMWTVTGGRATREVDPGTYYVTVSAAEYHTDYATINFSGVDPHTEPIALKPAFGYLSIAGGADLEGAGIFVDNRNVGTGNVKNVRIASGKHTLKVSKELYQSYEQQFNIEDGKSVTLTPQLTPNFATTTVKCADPQAEIYRDGKLLGTGTWRGPLQKGNYLFEVRRANHRPIQKQITVTSITTPVDINLGAPTPITGSLSVESTPAGATIAIDGNEVGTTPRNVHNLLIGNHTVKLTMPGYKSSEQTITVREGETARVNVRLENMGEAEIVVSPRYASLFVDGRRASTDTQGSYRFNAPVGSQHTATATESDYRTASKTFTIGERGITRINMVLKEKRSVAMKGTYFDIGASGPMWGIDLALGTYIKGVNLEFFLNIGLQASKEFYFATGYEDAYNTYAFHNVEYGLRLGYGFNCGKHFALVPQIGIFSPVATRTASEEGEKGDGLDKAAGFSGLLAVRVMIPCSEHFAISIIPEYRISLAKGEALKTMCELDPVVKGWQEGFNAKICATFTF